MKELIDKINSTTDALNKSINITKQIDVSQLSEEDKKIFKEFLDNTINELKIDQKYFKEFYEKNCPEEFKK